MFPGFTCPCTRPRACRLPSASSSGHSIARASSVDNARPTRISANISGAYSVTTYANLAPSISQSPWPCTRSRCRCFKAITASQPVARSAASATSTGITLIAAFSPLPPGCSVRKTPHSALPPSHCSSGNRSSKMRPTHSSPIGILVMVKPIVVSRTAFPPIPPAKQLPRCGNLTCSPCLLNPAPPQFASS